MQLMEPYLYQCHSCDHGIARGTRAAVPPWSTTGDHCPPCNCGIVRGKSRGPIVGAHADEASSSTSSKPRDVRTWCGASKRTIHQRDVRSRNDRVSRVSRAHMVRRTTTHFETYNATHTKPRCSCNVDARIGASREHCVAR